jgi:hypothetical protein
MRKARLAKGRSGGVAHSIIDPVLSRQRSNAGDVLAAATLGFSLTAPKLFQCKVT